MSVLALLVAFAANESKLHFSRSLRLYPRLSMVTRQPYKCLCSIGVVTGIALALAITSTLTPVLVHAQSKAKAKPPVIVEAIQLNLEPLVESVSAVGELRSNESIIIRPEVGGRINEIRFEEGATVAAGDVLVRFDDTVQRAELAQAQAHLQLSERTYARARSTFERGHTSEQILDEALGQVQINKAAAQLANARLRKMTISAPFSGIVGLRRVSLGGYLQPGDEIADLESIDPLKVDFQVSERYVRIIRKGGSVQVRLDAFPHRTLDATIYAIDSHVDTRDRSIAVRARLPNPDGQLRAGLFARIRLIVEDRPNSIVVPEESLIPRGSRRFVYRVIDGRATLTEVVLGLRRTGSVEIVSGLSAGDTIITAGQAKVREGGEVQIVPSSIVEPSQAKAGAS